MSTGLPSNGTELRGLGGPELEEVGEVEGGRMGLSLELAEGLGSSPEMLGDSLDAIGAVAKVDDVLG